MGGARHQNPAPPSRADLSPDSPRLISVDALSSLGLEQCAELKDFFAAPCVDDGAKADYDEIVSGAADGRLLVVASPLRRAVATVAIGLADRLKRVALDFR